MDESKGDKITRVLGIYTRLVNGYPVNKREEAERYGVNERSIQRDIDDIKDFLGADVDGVVNSVVYDRAEKGYRLKQVYNMKFTNSEILALCKILLDSRAFLKTEMEEMLRKLISCCVPEKNQKLVMDLVGNEKLHYVEPRHKSHFIDKMWDIGQAIQNRRYIEIDYTRMKDKATVTRRVKPAAILFSEYYFYLTAFIEDEEVRKGFEVPDDSYPTIYRIDRIQRLKVSEEKFHTIHRNRFEEGEFRKRIQFMCGGKLQTVTFRYSGMDIDAVLDRLPTARIMKEEDGVYTIRAEVFGKGIDMWFRSQGDYVKRLS